MPKEETSNKKRKMTRSELFGRHTHPTQNHHKVHIWKRDGKYLARGQFRNRSYGKTLGNTELEAEAELRNVMHRLEIGTFQRSSEESQKSYPIAPPSKITIRDFLNRHLSYIRKKNGKGTTANYQSRLSHVISFWDQPEIRSQYQSVSRIDRQFAEDLRGYLQKKLVSRNGRSMGTKKVISPRHVHNILTTFRAALDWGKDPTVSLLPVDFLNPITDDIVGCLPRKNPLRSPAFSLEQRCELVSLMDSWQLSCFAIPFILPLRPEDYTGLVISDIDFGNSFLKFETRMEGSDFNKGKMEFLVPFPTELTALLKWSICERQAGPVLLTPSVVREKRKPKFTANSNEDLESRFQNVLTKLPKHEPLTSQDRKRLFRTILKEFGGVSTDTVGKEFKKNLIRSGFSSESKLYDLRSSVTTELEIAGVSHLVQRYVTGHKTSDILNEYTSFTMPQLHGEMKKHFDRLQPLLEAITCRADELDLT